MKGKCNENETPFQTDIQKKLWCFYVHIKLMYVQCVYYICDPTPRGATVAIGMPQSGLARERGGPTRHRSTSAGGEGGEGGR